MSHVLKLWKIMYHNKNLFRMRYVFFAKPCVSHLNQFCVRYVFGALCITFKTILGAVWWKVCCSEDKIEKVWCVARKKTLAWCDMPHWKRFVERYGMEVLVNAIPRKRLWSDMVDHGQPCLTVIDKFWSWLNMASHVFYHGWLWLSMVNHVWLWLTMVDQKWLRLTMFHYGWQWLKTSSLIFNHIVMFIKGYATLWH